MNEQQRRELIDEIQRSTGTIGSDLPDELDVQGTTIDVREFVFECKRLDAIPEGERERIDDVKADLHRERLERKQRLEREDISVAEGEDLVESIHGLDRALNALDGLDEPDLSEQLRQEKLEDARELLSLMRYQG
jgi:hypothetical protein